MNRNPEVDQFMVNLKHPLKDELQRVREIIHRPNHLPAHTPCALLQKLALLLPQSQPIAIDGSLADIKGFGEIFSPVVTTLSFIGRRIISRTRVPNSGTHPKIKHLCEQVRFH